MKISRAPMQGLLLDTPPVFKLGTNALARNAYGAAAQEIVCAALSLYPIPINGNNEMNPDAERNGVFWEIKSVHRTSKVVVYDWRMKKEEASGIPLNYAILCHDCRKAKDGATLLELFALRGLEVIQLPAKVVHEIAAREPLQTLKSKTVRSVRCGYDRNGYADGYRNIPVKSLREATTSEGILSFALHGIQFDITHRKFPIDSSHSPR